jgi:murein DD-endopeptidase MepM/ murein hydrolase activator NlpD
VPIFQPLWQSMLFPLPRGAAYNYADTWGAPRAGGKQHKGTDIFAKRGTPVLAVDDGKAYAAEDPRGGRVVYLQSSNTGTRYYFAHLDTWVVPPLPGKTVRRGEQIGTVGTTGNAANTPPHLHFEMSPHGTPGVNPFPHLSAVDPRKTGRGPAAPMPQPDPATGPRIPWLGTLTERGQAALAVLVFGAALVWLSRSSSRANSRG